MDCQARGISNGKMIDGQGPSESRQLQRQNNEVRILLLNFKSLRKDCERLVV